MSALFFGLSTLDLQYLIPSHPQPNTKSKTETANIEIGGPATNAAITFAHLYGTSTLASVIGQHPLTHYFNQQFQHFHLKHIDLSPTYASLPTIASVFTSKDNGDRSIITNKPPAPDISHELINTLLQTEIQIVLVDGFYMEAAIRLATLAQEKGITVILDGGSWKAEMEHLLPYVNIAICSADFHLPDGYPALANYFRQTGIRHFAITRWEKAPLYLNQMGSRAVYRSSLYR